MNNDPKLPLNVGWLQENGLLIKAANLLGYTLTMKDARNRRRSIWNRGLCDDYFWSTARTESVPLRVDGSPGIHYRAVD